MVPLSLFPLPGVPRIEPGVDLASVVVQAARGASIALQDEDVVVVAQKIVSKAEGRYVDLRLVTPSPDAIHLSALCGKDARLVELVLAESTEVLRCQPGVIIVRHRLGLVLANAGIDQSNLPDNHDSERVLLLPLDPDRSAAHLRGALEQTCGCRFGIAVIDSLGRAWRNGTVGTCIGASGIESLRDMRGERDFFGRLLQSTVVGLGDELASAASFVMGQGAEGTPIVVVRGALSRNRDGVARDLVRPVREDLFK
jgi:coenzyme F420-0:L-glutamate ligase/coenzyme F420-1:gamma-L-glutamate ligase